MACNYVNICSELGKPEHAALLDGVDVLDGVDAEGSLFRYDVAVFCLSFMAKDALGRGLCVYMRARAQMNRRGWTDRHIDRQTRGSMRAGTHQRERERERDIAVIRKQRGRRRLACVH
jgi:hypothetical protein